jgi:spore coat protein U-like protein
MLVKTLRLSLLLWLWLHLPAAQALCIGPLCSCTFSTGNVVFGSVNPIAIGSTDSTGSVRVSCGGVVGLLIPYKVELSAGGSGNTAARRMSSGAQMMNYGLYSDSARLSNWGDIAHGTEVSGFMLLDALGLAPAVTHTVYGRIPSGQTTTAPGAYADTITVTVTYY